MGCGLEEGEVGVGGCEHGAPCSVGLSDLCGLPSVSAPVVNHSGFRCFLLSHLQAAVRKGVAAWPLPPLEGPGQLSPGLEAPKPASPVSLLPRAVPLCR